MLKRVQYRNAGLVAGLALVAGAFACASVACNSGGGGTGGGTGGTGGTTPTTSSTTSSSKSASSTTSSTSSTSSSTSSSSSGASSSSSSSSSSGSHDGGTSSSSSSSSSSGDAGASSSSSSSSSSSGDAGASSSSSSSSSSSGDAGASDAGASDAGDAGTTSDAGDAGDAGTTSDAGALYTYSETDGGGWAAADATNFDGGLSSFGWETTTVFDAGAPGAFGGTIPFTGDAGGGEIVYITYTIPTAAYSNAKGANLAGETITAWVYGQSTGQFQVTLLANSGNLAGSQYFTNAALPDGGTPNVASFPWAGTTGEWLPITVQLPTTATATFDPTQVTSLLFQVYQEGGNQPASATVYVGDVSVQ